MPLAEFVETYCRLHAVPNLAGSTPDFYKLTWVNHIMPRLGDYGVRELTPKRLARFREELERAGTSTATVRKAMAILQSVDRATRSRAREIRHPLLLVPAEPACRPSGAPRHPRPIRAGLPLQRVSRGQVAPQRAVPRAAPRRDCGQTARTSEQALDGAYRVRDRRRLLLARRLQSETVACADRREQA